MKTIKTLALLLVTVSCSTPDQEQLQQTNTQTHILRVDGLPGHEPVVTLNGVQISSGGSSTVYTNARTGDVVKGKTLCLYGPSGNIYYPIKVYIDDVLVKSQSCDLIYTIQ